MYIKNPICPNCNKEINENYIDMDEIYKNNEGYVTTCCDNCDETIKIKFKKEISYETEICKININNKEISWEIFKNIFKKYSIKNRYNLVFYSNNLEINGLNFNNKEEYLSININDFEELENFNDFLKYVSSEVIYSKKYEKEFIKNSQHIDKYIKNLKEVKNETTK